MNAWPLVHRELLVGSRRRWTQWSRVVVAVVATLIGGAYIPIVSLGGMMSPGLGLFTVLVWMAFAVTGLFGVFFAADVISSERREGTLGLLFLTRLRGFDVVFGKLCSTSLRAGFGMFAATPVLAIPILLGGVTFEAYWHAALVLANTLFLSVSLGLLVSSFNRNPVRAVMGTLIFILLLVGGTMAVDGILVELLDERSFVPRLAHASPAFALFQGTQGSARSMFISIGIQHVLAWLFLVAAGVKTGDHAEKARVETKSKTRRWLFAPQETTSERKLREKRPVGWLISHRSRAPTIVALVFLALGGLLMIYNFWGEPGQEYWTTGVAMALSSLAGLFGFILLVWIAVDAARRTGDSRSTGALELVMTTPLTDREIVSGFWFGTMRVFRVAVVVWLLLQTVALVLQTIGMLDMMKDSSAEEFSMWEWQISQIISGGMSLINTVLECAALIWVGMWLGLKSERTTAAAALTFVFVIVLPTIAISIVSVIFFAVVGVAGALSGWMNMWLPGLAVGVVAVAINIGFIVWARRQLTENFRKAASGTMLKQRIKKFAPKQKAPPPLPV